MKHPEVLRYFHHEFPKTNGGVQQWVTPVLNKIGDLLFDPDLRLMFSGKSTINFRQIIDNQLVLLVNAAKGQLSESNSALLAAFIVAHIQKAALSRQDGETRHPFYFYLDEFQNYATDNIRDILSESRKYALTLVLAHQYLDQLSPDTRWAVLNTRGTLACFRIGYDDAEYMAHQLFPPDYLSRWQWELRFLRVGHMPLPLAMRSSQPLTQAELISHLTELPNREFIVRRRGPYPPLKQRTLDLYAPQISDALYFAREELVRVSAQRYGRLKHDTESTFENGPTFFTERDITDYEEIPPPALSAGE